MAGKAGLVDQIKAIQRESPESKQAWWDYCDAHLGGIKDPNRHDEATLEEFVAAVLGGGMTAMARPAPSWGSKGAAPSWGSKGAAPSWGSKGFGKGKEAAWGMPPAAAGWGYAGGGAAAAAPAAASSANSHTDFIKFGQRVSENFKSAWRSYCTLHGNGFFDPAKYDDNFVKGFIEAIGALAAEELGAQVESAGVDADALRSSAVAAKRLAPSAGPPAKRAAPAGAVSYGGGGDPEKDALVQQVKDLQRSSADAKQAWWAHCDTELGGVKDPNRHDAEVLQNFLYSQGVGS